MKFRLPWSKKDPMLVSSSITTQPEPKEKYCFIYIVCKTRTISYKRGPIVDNNINSFLDFQKWFFGRPQSEYYVMIFDKGKELIPRKEIVSWKIFMGE